MPDKSFDDQFNEAWEKLGGDRLVHQWYDLQRRKMLPGKLRTLKEIEIFYPRLRTKIAYSDMLRREAIRYIQRKQQDPFIVKCPTCNQEVDRFDFVQIQSGLMRYFFNITNDDL